MRTRDKKIQSFYREWTTQSESSVESLDDVFVHAAVAVIDDGCVDGHQREKNFSIFLLFCFSQFTQFRISTNAKSQLKFNQKRLVFKTEYTKCNMNCKSPLKRTTNPTKNMKNFNLFRWININVKSSWNWICLFRVHQIKELFCLHCDFAVDVHCKTFKR